MIRKLVKKCKKERGTRITEEEQIEIEQEIEKINQKTESSIIILGTLWSEQLQEELTRQQSVLKGKLVAKNSIASRLEIKEYIDCRCKIIKDNQRKIINSLLEKLFKKVVIDKLLTDERGSKELFNKPEAVLKRTAKYFKKQFKKRNFQQKKISNSQEEIYKPIT